MTDLLPYHLSSSKGAETPTAVASFDNYSVAKSSALRRLRLRSDLHETNFVRVTFGHEVVFEASYFEGDIEVHRDMMP